MTGERIDRHVAVTFPPEIDVFEHGDARELLIAQQRGGVWIDAGARPVTRYVRADVVEAKARAVIQELEATAPVLAAVRAALSAQPGESTEDAAKRVMRGVHSAASVAEHWQSQSNVAHARLREVLAILEERCGACRDRTTSTSGEEPKT